MEKRELPLVYETSSRPTKSSTSLRGLGIAAFSLAAFLWLAYDSFDVIKAVSRFGPDRRAIKWFPCPDTADLTFCAFFDVPMDHLNPQANETVTLAMRKLPATAKAADRKGTLIINPGGPGGSGTEAVAREGPDLMEALDGLFDIVSFDPRGINMTTPSIDCFPSEGPAMLFQLDLERLGLRYEAQPYTDLNASEPITSQELRWAAKIDGLARALDQTCRDHGSKILQHSSTASTSRDIKLIVEALGEDKLNYWGFSYGTTLGSTFAAMFPDSVGHMVLDGVSDPTAYTTDMWQWGRYAMDYTHIVLDAFISTCVEAGPERCALAQGNDTVASIHARIDALRIALRDSPLPVAASNETLGGGLVTTSSIQHVIFRSLYAPSRWSHLASILAEAEKGNGTGIFTQLYPSWLDLSSRDQTNNPFHRYMETTGSALGHHAVACLDTDRAALSDTSLPTLVDFMKEMGRLSISGECRRWSFHSNDVYRGPWSLEDGLNKTETPILFVGNMGDPVTPLSATKRTAGKMGGTVLVQNG
ncbi:hypothetical protein MNV49_006718 [Pseudohyphozyma bogoriensis]|nr:hypothetical protein MNV49_006718 [Pseudohyphozyma bogoriensis]